MKRQDLVRHLQANGCEPKREGSNHSIWANPANGRWAAVPRHREVDDRLVRGICGQLGVPRP